MNTFWPSGRIIQGDGALSKISEFIGDPASVSLVIDVHVTANPAIAEAQKHFADKRIYRHSGAEPSIDGVNAVAEICKGTTQIVAIGGGSTIDIAKAASIVSAGGSPLERFEGAERVDCEPVPIVAVPTTAGTGSEVSSSCVLEAADGSRKVSIRSQKLMPRIAILDPRVLTTTPRPVIAAAGIDALTHAVEAFFSTRAFPVTDALALGAARLIAANLPRYHNEPTNLEAAAAVALGASMAAMAFTSARVGIAHAIASAIGPHVHLPHGVCVGFGLPFAMRMNGEAIGRERFSLLLQALGRPDGSDAPARTEQWIRDFMLQLDMPQTASAAGRHFEISKPLLDAIINSGRLDTNPAAVSEPRLTEILAAVRG